MWGFSKRRFLATLGLSVIILGITGLIQAFDIEEWNFSLLGSACTLTGYPVAVCLKNAGSGLLFSVSLVNTFFWFALLNFLYSAKQIRVGLIALVIWFGTIVIEKQFGLVNCISKPSWYKLTGYPIAECVTRDEKIIVFTVYLTNVAFWFLVIKLIQKLFIRLKK